MNRTELLIGATIGFMIGAFGMGTACDYDSNKDAITHHAAHYDPQTGAFTWNDEVKP